MKIKLSCYAIFFIVLFACDKETKKPFISNDLKQTLDIYMVEHENLKHVKMIQIEFRKWENKCSLVFTAFPKSDQSKKSFMHRGKMIVFFDEKDCSTGLVNPSFVNDRSVLKVIFKNEKLDTIQSVYPMSTDFYHFDENNKIQYSPKL